MPICSMTGFARREGHGDGVDWVWELKSVNGKGLDIRMRLPGGHDELDAAVRSALAERFKRGNLNVSLQVNRTQGLAEPRINRTLLDQIMSLHREFAGTADRDGPRLDVLLGIRGVIELEERKEDPDARAARIEAMLQDFDVAVDALAGARAGEGARLETNLTAHLDEIEQLAGKARDCAAIQPEAIRARLREQVADLLDSSPSLPEERLAQEAALLASKADVREELDRLDAHISGAREMLRQDQPVGRSMDFLCQEFNREANTLCSKVQDIELTRIGLDLKAAVDRLREQVQNVE